MITVSLTEKEVKDILLAIKEAQQELCVGIRFPEATAYNQRLDAIVDKLKGCEPKG